MTTSATSIGSLGNEPVETVVRGGDDEDQVTVAVRRPDSPEDLRSAERRLADASPDDMDGRMLGWFPSVTEWFANLDIDVRIEGPDGKNLYEGERESNGKYTFAAHMDGVYRYCFSNKMSTMTPKIVMFTMEILDAVAEKEGAADDESSHNKLESMIKELGTALTSVKHEQDYMNVRDKIHRTINESTNSRVVLWSFFEALVLVSMTIGQVYYLKRFFEVRRVV